MGSTFGHLFRMTTWGESHGGAVGVTVDGCPPQMALSEADIQAELDRRRPGQSRVTTQRREADACQILSGVFDGHTLGSPILILVWNTDAKQTRFSPLKDIFIDRYWESQSPEMLTGLNLSPHSLYFLPSQYL